MLFLWFGITVSLIKCTNLCIYLTHLVQNSISDLTKYWTQILRKVGKISIDDQNEIFLTSHQFTIVKLTKL